MLSRDPKGSDMASEPTTQAAPQQWTDPDRPTGTALPAVLLIALIAAIVFGAVWLVRYIIGVETGAEQETRFIFRRLEEAPPVGRDLEPALFWLPILVPILILGFVYAIWMYVRESRAIGWVWATFLALLRCTVYTILAGVFLLPALQTWEKNEQYSKVLILFDLSGSMNLSDEVPTEGKTMLTRLDHVAGFLTAVKDKGKSKDFLQRLQEKNPVSLYGFGGKLDEEFKELKGGQGISPLELVAWLRIDLKQWVLEGLSPDGTAKVRDSKGFDPTKPATSEWAAEWVRTGEVPEFTDPNDKTVFEKKRADLPKRVDLRQQILAATNYGDSLLAMLTRESNNMLAGVIIVGDGQNNQGSPSTFDEIRRRAQFARVPIFTIAVGEEREQINIRITDLQAPEQAPPDDKFVVRVHVDGEGLADKEFEVFLDVILPGDEKPALTLKTTGTFKPSAGSVPHGQVEFSFDPMDTNLEPLTVVDKMSGKREFISGEGGLEWKFIARTAKHKGESFAGKEHISDAATVQVIKRPLRVLLVAGGPTREYQFVRRLLVNEVDKKRAELSVYLQVSDPKGQRVQDVPNERLLKAFPDSLKPPDDPTISADERYYNLGQYDVVICFDPDWTKIPLTGLRLLQTWVQDQAGGLIVVGGPIYTWQLARTKSYGEQLRPIVDLFPVRVEEGRLVGQNIDRPTDEAWRLNFQKVGDEFPFLKLDETGEHPLAGWEEFFTGKKSGSPISTSEKVARGFYAYFPVKSVKAGATVVATFADPRGRMVREDDPNKTDEQPYLVTMPFGGGKVVYLSSGELWRLRLYRENFHERFWTKLARYAGSATQLRQTSRGVLVMSRQFTAGQQVRLEARLRGANLNEPLHADAEVKVKVVPPEGVVMKPSEFKLQPKKEGEWDGWFRGQFEVKAPGEYKLDLAIPGTTDVLRSKFLVKESNPELDNARPDYGLLYALASPVSDLRVGDAQQTDLRQKLRGSIKPELTDKLAANAPAGKENEPRLFFNLQTAGIIPDYLGNERKIQRSRGPIDDLWDHGPALFGYDENGKPRIVALVLMIVVGLLSAEWLTRKLLKLA